MSTRRLGLFKKPSSGAFAFNNALNFDGVDDYVSFTQATGQDTWAVSLWFNSLIISTNTQAIIADHDSNKYIQINNTLGIIVREVGGTQVFFNFPTLLDNTYYNAIISSNALSCRAYLNGVESTIGAQVIASSGTSPANQFATIGQAKSTNYMEGKVDEWGLWYGSYLTPADVAILSNPLTADVSAINPTTLWAGSHMDEMSGNTTANLGSSGIITLNNFPIDDSQWVGH